MKRSSRRWFGAIALSVTIAGSSLVAVSPTVAGAASASLPLWDPTSLPLLSVQPGTGPAAPVLRGDIVDGSIGLATSLQPTLTWAKVPLGVASARFVITTIASRNPQTLWSGSGTVNGGKVAVTVPAGILQQGRTYAWQASSTQNPAVATPRRVLQVDVQRSNVQDLFPAGPVSIGEVSGEPVTMFTSGGLSTKEGTSSFSLLYRPTNRAQVGIPTGWSLETGGTTSNWTTLHVNPDQSVTLTSRSGEAVTFVPADAAGDSYRPDFGVDQTWPNGSPTTLVPEHQLDGSTIFTATEQSRMVTVFAPTSTGTTTAEPTEIWSDGTTVLQQTWSQGRLQAIVDPTSGSNSYTFAYGGSPSCPSITGVSGAIAAPSGMLCGATDWSGQQYGFEYVETPAGPRLARVVAGVGALENAQVTDYEWDSSGRLVGVRSADATADVASGAIPGLGNQDPRALYQLAYDAEGRVSSVTPPAGLVPADTQTAAQMARIPTTFTYHGYTSSASTTPTFSASAGGRAVSTELASPSTMLADWTSSGTGDRTVMTWDTATGSLLTQRDLITGSTTKTIYDAQGRPIEQLGPTTSSLTSSSTPTTTTAYDETSTGQAWTGLATFYYDNPSFAGTPVSSSIGPSFSGGNNPPATLAFSFPTPPTGVTPGPDGWAARMTGSYLASATGTYVFTNETAQATVWVDGVPCLRTCTLSLSNGGSAALRIDVPSTPAAPAIRLLVTTPSGGPNPVPTSALRPNLGYVTSETTVDSLSASSPSSLGAEQALTVTMSVDPATGEVLSEQTPAGTVTSTTYNRDGSPATTTNPAGQTTTISYYGDQQSSPATCDTTTSVAQRGLVQTMSRPGATASYQASPTAGQSSVTTPSTLSCAPTLGNPFEQASGIAGIGTSVGNVSTAYIGNSPMVSLQSAVTPTTSKIEQTTVDLLGRTWTDLDEWGTTTSYAYDPATGDVTSMTQRTAKGQQRVESYTYNVDGQVTSETVDAHLLESLAYVPGSGLPSTATLANGVVVTFGYGANLQLTSESYRFPNGSTTTDTVTYSTGGRALCDSTSAPDGTSSQCYSGDLNGKIVGATETGTLPVLATSWTASYPGAQGANADRASLASTLSTQGKAAYATSDSQRVTAATYDAGDALTSMQVANQNVTLSADASGRTTQMGGTTLGYDALGNLVSAANGGSNVAFGYGPSGMDQETYTPAPAVQSARAAVPKERTPTTTRSPTTTSTSTTTSAPTTTSTTPTTTGSATTVPGATTSEPSTPTTTASTSTTVPKAPPAARAAPRATLQAPTPITVHYSGTDLLLDANGSIVGQVLSLGSGVNTGLNASGTPVDWSYDGVEGSVLWRSTGSAPSQTAVYDPWGSWNAASAPPQPADAISLVMDQMAWGDGQGGTTLPVDASMVQLGQRTYDTASGRFLQADSNISSDNLYAYANGDPIDGTDPSGNFGSFGDIFSMIVGVVVGIAAAVAIPVTGGASSALLAFAVGTVASAAADFGGSVLGQAIDNGGFSNIDWAAAGMNAGIGLGLSVVSFGATRLVAAPWAFLKHQQAKALLSRNMTLFKAISGKGEQGIRGVRSPIAMGNITGSLDALGTNTAWQRIRRRIFWNRGPKAPITELGRSAGDAFSVSDLNRILAGDATASSARTSSVVTYNMLDELAPPTNPLLVQNRTSMQEALDELNLAYQPQRLSSGSISVDSGLSGEAALNQYQLKLLTEIKGW